MLRRVILRAALLVPITGWAESGKKTMELEIAGLTWVACAFGVQLNLSRLPGVEQCNVSYRNGRATLVFAEGVEPDVGAVKAVVSKLGFQPGEATVRTGQ